MLALLPLFFLYAAYLILDARQYRRTGEYENRPARLLKLASVVLLALLVWWPAPGEGELTLLRLAFVFTVLGDLFFSVLRRFVVGVAMFAVVQCAYIARHAAGLRLAVDEALILTGALAYGLLLFLAVRRGLAAKRLVWPVGLYIAVSAVSLWMALAQLVRGAMPMEYALRVALGVSLLGLCDSTIPVRMVLQGRARQRVGLATWAVYVPALVLLAASGPTLLAW
jgi:hypothetical protein